MFTAEHDTGQVIETNTQKIISVASLALVTYEYAITFKHEINHIWKSKSSITSAFLIGTRYTMLLVPLIQILLEFHPRFGSLLQWQNIVAANLRHVSSYRPYKILSLVMYNLGLVEIAGLSALRAYALSNRNWYISTLIMILGALIPVVTNTLAFVTTPPGAPESALALCIVLGHAIRAADQLYGYLCCFSIIVGELLVIAVTWRRTLSQIKLAKNLGMERLSLATCLVRDGSLYFIAMVGVNILGVIGEISNVSIFPEMMMIAQYLIPIIVCRLIVNLRAIDRVKAVSRPLTALSAVQFHAPQDIVDAEASHVTEETLLDGWSDSDDDDDDSH